MLRKFSSMGEDLENKFQVGLRLRGEFSIDDQMEVTQLYDFISVTSYLLILAVDLPNQEERDQLEYPCCLEESKHV